VADADASVLARKVQVGCQRRPDIRLLLPPFDRWEGYAAKGAELISFRDQHIPHPFSHHPPARQSNRARWRWTRNGTVLRGSMKSSRDTTYRSNKTSHETTPEESNRSRTLRFVRVECRNLNTYGFGLVEADASSRRPCALVAWTLQTFAKRRSNKIVKSSDKTLGQLSNRVQMAPVNNLRFGPEVACIRAGGSV
jgi:hypothetical protein